MPLILHFEVKNHVTRPYEWIIDPKILKKITPLFIYISMTSSILFIYQQHNFMFFQLFGQFLSLSLRQSI